MNRWQPSMGMIGVGLGILVAGAPGCDESPKATNTCAPGSERCPCYGNGTCDDGLACRSERCVVIDDAGGGTNGGGTNGGGTNGGGTNGGGTNGGGTNGGDAGQVQGGTSANGGVPNGGGVTVAVYGGTTSLVGAGGTASNGGLAAGGNPNPGGGSAIGGAAATNGGTGASGGKVTANGGTIPVSGGATSRGGASGTSIGGASAGGAASSAGAPPVGVNLIQNGDFSQQKNYWMLTDYSGATNLWTSVASGSYCFGAESTFQYSLGWPASSADAITLGIGTTYRLSFSLRANASYSVAIKVRELMMSQLASFSTTMLVAASEQPAMYEFAVTSAFLPSGLYFSGTMASGNYLCVSAVSLVRLT